MQVESIEANVRSISNQTVRHPGFISFKTAGPIPYVFRWHRDLLIQVTLDPAIDEIHYEHPTTEGDESLNLRLVADGTAIHVIALRDADVMSLRPGPPGGALLRRSFVLTEPRASDARAVWATRRLLVQIGDRLRVLLAVGDGRQHSISDLVPSIRDQGYDPFEAILSLVCRGDLAIDLRDGLHPDARIARSKPRVRALPSDDQLGTADRGLTIR
ncbi:hypothetical protein [Methylobacterium mesophilicum]|uniref:hypothetical protein n=1 Tax=Methylobacterium mesophilicum TaxID=39956 RepID=UPI001EE1F390|nr:hypothetical protein [Methylobacterium mesophilicum]